MTSRCSMCCWKLLVDSQILSAHLTINSQVLLPIDVWSALINAMKAFLNLHGVHVCWQTRSSKLNVVYILTKFDVGIFSRTHQFDLALWYPALCEICTTVPKYVEHFYCQEELIHFSGFHPNCQSIFHSLNYGKWSHVPCVTYFNNAICNNCNNLWMGLEVTLLTGNGRFNSNLHWKFIYVPDFIFKCSWPWTALWINDLWEH